MKTNTYGTFLQKLGDESYRKAFGSFVQERRLEKFRRKWADAKRKAAIGGYELQERTWRRVESGVGQPTDDTLHLVCFILDFQSVDELINSFEAWFSELCKESEKNQKERLSNIDPGPLSPPTQDLQHGSQSVEAFRKWLLDRISGFFQMVRADFLRTDLMARNVHTKLLGEVFSESGAERRRASRVPFLNARFDVDHSLLSGVIPRDLYSELYTREWTIACPVTIIGALACFYYLRAKGVNINLFFGATQAIEFLALAEMGRLEPAPDVIVGLDGLAVQSQRKQSPLYIPLCGSLAAELCLISGSFDQLASLDRGIVVMPPGDTNSVTLADEAALQKILKPNRFKRVTDLGSISHPLAFVKENQESVLFTYGLLGFAAKEYGIGQRISTMSKTGNGAGKLYQRAEVAPGVVVIHRDHQKQSKVGEAIGAAFIHAYNELRYSRQIFEKTILNMLDDSDFIESLSAAMGFSIMNRED